MFALEGILVINVVRPQHDQGKGRPVYPQFTGQRVSFASQTFRSAQSEVSALAEVKPRPAARLVRP